jgi:hypothetical protein
MMYELLRDFWPGIVVFLVIAGGIYLVDSLARRSVQEIDEHEIHLGL